MKDVSLIKRLSYMVKIVELSNNKEWDDIVCSFLDYDVYYLNGYLRSLQAEGHGEAFLFLFDNDDFRAFTVMFKRDISNSFSFLDRLEKGRYFDVVSPYGYGGFIFDRKVDLEQVKLCYSFYENYLQSQGVVSAFVRYHPLLNNAKDLKQVSTIIDLGNTIHIDLTDEETIWNNMIGKTRNKVRKAQKKGVIIKHSKDLKLFEDFIAIYNATMDGHKASKEYYFSNNFYHSIHKNLNDNYEMFYAVFEGKIIAMSIILFSQDKMHYHLSGSVFEYRNLAAVNLLLFEAARWGVSRGYKSLHLGGGLGAGEDSLYVFKSGFNKYSKNQFSIGKDIINIEKYNELVEIRRDIDPTFNTDSLFFPLYRS